MWPSSNWPSSSRLAGIGDVLHDAGQAEAEVDELDLLVRGQVQNLLGRTVLHGGLLPRTTTER